MKPYLIEKTLDGIKPINHNILKLILALPEDQQENALMILTGTIVEVPIATELTYNESKWWDIANITYNPLRDEVSFNFSCYQSISNYCAWSKDSEEYKDLMAKIFECKTEDSARNLARSFSGQNYYTTEYNEVKTCCHHTCSLDRFKSACNGGDLSGNKRRK